MSIIPKKLQNLFIEPKKSKKRRRNVIKKTLKEHVQSKADLFEEIKSKQYVKDTLDMFKDDNLPNPFRVVEEFIKEKGLKLYGGQAIHEHLKKKKKPIYGNHEFPDYDVFSPNAWEHAKELSQKLFDIGFFFVEAKSSKLNDSKHQTYKVSVDLIYVLDLTQVGCTEQQIKNNNCKKCGSLNGLCYSLFNNIPAIDILKNTNKEITETYDYESGLSLYPKKMFVCSPNWLKTSMYLEMSQPFNDPSRLVKISERLELFENEFAYDTNKCNMSIPLQSSLEIDHISIYHTILDFVKKYINENKLIHYGITSYNFFTKTDKKIPVVPVIDYEVYTDEDPDRYYLELHEKLTKQFKNANFQIIEQMLFWKDIDADNYQIVFNIDKSQYLPIVTFTKSYECMPYIQYGGIRYATIDRMKYNYYRAVSLDKIIYNSEMFPKNYACLLKNLLKVEKNKKKETGSNLLNGKFQRFRKECVGSEVPHLIGNLYGFFGENVRFANKTKYYIDTPKDGYITKVYPLDKELTNKMFRPAEQKTKYYNKQLKFVKKSKKLIKKRNKVEF